MDFEYLDSERKKLWERLEKLDEKLKKKTPELEQEVQEIVVNVKQRFNEIQELLTKAETNASEFNIVVERVSESDSSIRAILESVKIILTETEQSRNSISALKTEIDQWYKSISEQNETIQSVFKNSATIATNLQTFEKQCEQASDFASKIEATHKQIISRKKELDELYYEVFGYTETDPKTGEETAVHGLKDELDNAYKEIKNDFEDYKKKINEHFQKNEERSNLFFKERNEECKNLINDCSKEFNEIKTRIEGLLPNALSTGLSYAYSSKKGEEQTELQAHKKSFRNGIIGLAAVSIIPIVVSIYGLCTNVPLNETILRLPRLVIAILPLYIPVFWIAYSSNKRVNLSKRLIEEYSHKEALSRTYEGLSTQISNLSDSAVATELKEKLLYNILEVSSENPGKLITDYNKSDHPVMDALDKSVRLTEAVERLGKIPGFTKLAGVLSEKAEQVLEKQKEKAEQALEAKK